ncbi:MAG: hypothetical protein Q4B99_00190 [Clostridia bacterium]|nr:hypothetical protein [Clostridia bacterium]
MKTKVIIIIFACVLLACFAVGATGMAQFGSSTADETGGDRLIGVLITMAPLNTFCAANEGRFYASLVETPPIDAEMSGAPPATEYAFTDVDGISYFCPLYADGASSYHGASSNEGISDGHTSLDYADDGNAFTLSLEGTVYVASDVGRITFYYNPVYQAEEGDVYAIMADMGDSFANTVAGLLEGTYTMSETIRTAKSPLSEEATTNVALTVRFIDPPASVTVIQLDGANRVLAATEYAPGKLPDSIAAEPEAEYIIVESRSAAGVSRELYQPGDGVLFAFYRRDDGICVKQYCDIEWSD